MLKKSGSPKNVSMKCSLKDLKFEQFSPNKNIEDIIKNLKRDS